jgi:hypothetical protein
MRFSASGMWGIANYFAVNASYCDTKFFFRTREGDKQIFFANVIIGDCC